MRIAILAVDSMFDSGLAVTLDVLATANALRGEAAATTPPFEVTVTAIRNEVRTGHALHLATTPLAELPAPPDLLVMPAVGLRAPAEVIEIVRGHEALPHVAALHRAGTALAAACSGTFFLAEAGVLDGRVATTSWWLGPAFRGRYGAVHLRDSAVVVGDERVTTAGAAFAHIDLALSVVQRQSPAPGPARPDRPRPRRPAGLAARRGAVRAGAVRRLLGPGGLRRGRGRGGRRRRAGLAGADGGGPDRAPGPARRLVPGAGRARGAAAGRLHGRAGG